MTTHSNIQYAWYENALFRYRGVILILSLLATVFFAYRASFVRPDTRLERLIPGSHAFVQNARQFLGSEQVGGSSVIRVAVEKKDGTILDYDHLVTLQQISDALSLMDGVNTQSLNSLWAPGMLWFAVTPAGFDSGPVIKNETFADTPASMDEIRTNVLRAGIVGSYVSNDFKASMIDFEVLPISPKTRQPLDTNDFADRLEKLRQKYQTENLSIHIIGDVKKIADLVNGFGKIALFFLGALAITAALLFQYSRCLKSTLAPLACSIVAVIWQLGSLNLLGYGLGVFSVLVPFLVFAIAVSHGVQVINAFTQETTGGATKLEAAKITFHRLHKPGLVALISDGIGFAMLFIIDIGAIKDLALVASVGVALVVFTNLVLLPIVMSYIGVTPKGLAHSRKKLTETSALWDGVASFSKPTMARVALIVGVLLLVVGLITGRGLKIGDLDKGAPELRQDSPYNLDSSYITTNFSTSTDLMTVFVGTPEGGCEKFKVIDLIDRLGWRLQNTQGVQSVSSPATTAKDNRFFGNEGNLKLYALPRDERVLQRAMAMTGFTIAGATKACNMQQIDLELADHKQGTLQRAVNVVQTFAAENDDADVRFRLGDGNAAYEAATNQVIERAQYLILAYVYGVVALMCLLTFRSVLATVCVLLPLVLTSVLCQGLMAMLGIGVKVATLPVIALGVGIGVDYGIYIFSRLESLMREGHSLYAAYVETLKTTGKAVCFTGITLAVGVATWFFSPIKFQADMGVLLTFMFLWNMIGALLLLPALACFLIKPAKYAPADAATAET